MWPFLLDMTKLECKKALRNLELEAYSNIVTVFRAQGELTSKKIEILQELQVLLHITIDRHKAELRRAINDEKLFTISKRLSSTNSSNINTKWHCESKRVVPVLPRLPPNTYYKLLAEQIVEKSKCFLETLAQPSDTELKKNEKENLEINVNNTLPKLADKDPNVAYLNDDLTVNIDNPLVQNIKPSELMAKYLDNKNSSDLNNGIIKKLLENKELREKYQKQLDDLKNEIKMKKIKNEENQKEQTEFLNTSTSTSSSAATTTTPSITVTAITLPTSNVPPPITTTTISVNPTSSNQKVILKTLNTGTMLNQTQIKTTDALKSLVMNANSNSSQTNDVKLTNIKQVILTTKTNSKVILVPNPVNNNNSSNQESINDNQTSTTTTIQQNLATHNHSLLSKLTTSNTIPKLVVLKTNLANTTSLPTQLVQTTSVEPKTVKIISSPISLLLQNNDKIPTELHYEQKSIKPIIVNNFNYFKDGRLNQKIENSNNFEDSKQLNSSQDNDLLLNFRNENEFYNLLPNIPPISPAISSTNININTQKSQDLSLNCFQESFKSEIEKDENKKFITLKSEVTENRNLKRKRLDSCSDSNCDTSLLSPTETNFSTSSTNSNISTINSSPPNSFETNLNFIKEMLENLNENNFDSKVSQENKHSVNKPLSNDSKDKNLIDETNAYQTANSDTREHCTDEDSLKYNIKRVKFHNSNTFSCHLTSVNNDLS